MAALNAPRAALFEDVERLQDDDQEHGAAEGDEVTDDGAASAEAKQTGDTIAGTITYSTKTNGNPDCKAVECSATQKFNGARPPK